MGLIGGVFLIWCSHAVCIGWHFMPIAEGRNDFFSAVMSRWKVAPKWVVYDFACQGAAYALAREAEYWRHTRWYIDQFHSGGHGSCSPSLRLSHAMYTDSTLRLLNSSAAECGNSGLKRIRKSVSFMTQEHAILFVKVFLDVWNRKKIGGA